jgi:hypothetical protein
VLNPANINRGANHLAQGETADSLTTREKVRLSVDVWRTIKTAVEHGTPIPTNSSKNMLLGYHYALSQQAKQLAKERIEIQKMKDSAIAASDAARRARSDASYTNRRHHQTWIKIRKSRVLRKTKHLQKPRLVFPIGRRARKHYTKNS